MCVPVYVVSLQCVGGEDFIQRTTIVGILLAFRKLSLQSLNSVLGKHIPFMFASILDFKSNLSDKDSRVSNIYIIVYT